MKARTWAGPMAVSDKLPIEFARRALDSASTWAANAVSEAYEAMATPLGTTSIGAIAGALAARRLSPLVKMTINNALAREISKTARAAVHQKHIDFGPAAPAKPVVSPTPQAAAYLPRPTSTFTGMPKLREDGFLPTGTHKVTWQEFEATYATNALRAAHARSLRQSIPELVDKGTERMFLGGSYLTNRLIPSDIDLVVKARPHSFLDQNNFALSPYRHDMKYQRGLDVLGEGLLDFMQFNSRVNRHVGILELDLATVPRPLPAVAQ